MFLLIQRACANDAGGRTCFTFHYVSINTEFNRNLFRKYWSLHSTMFLLIRKTWRSFFLDFIFTFHYVSINTVMCARYNHTYQPLHSTMFLLIRLARRTGQNIEESLHSTMFLLILFSQSLHEICNIILYIPLCFY